MARKGEQGRGIREVAYQKVVINPLQRKCGREGVYENIKKK
jgi:hypothetical protein